jgi:hypothetical protein
VFVELMKETHFLGKKERAEIHGGSRGRIWVRIDLKVMTK